jgi:hypothetical protein
MHVEAARPAERRAAAFLGEPVALHAWHHREQVVPVADRQREIRDGNLLPASGQPMMSDALAALPMRRTRANSGFGSIP